jgi:hypothetical protein
MYFLVTVAAFAEKMPVVSTSAAAMMNFFMIVFCGSVLLNVVVIISRQCLCLF